MCVSVFYSSGKIWRFQCDFCCCRLVLLVVLLSVYNGINMAQLWMCFLLLFFYSLPNKKKIQHVCGSSGFSKNHWKWFHFLFARKKKVETRKRTKELSGFIFRLEHDIFSSFFRFEFVCVWVCSCFFPANVSATYELPSTYPQRWVIYERSTIFLEIRFFLALAFGMEPNQNLYKMCMWVSVCLQIYQRKQFIS